MLVATTVSALLGFAPQAPPVLPQTFVATITTNASGTAPVGQKGVSTEKQWYDYANKRLRKDAADGTTKVYRYDKPEEPAFPPKPGDPPFATPKGYHFQLSNPNMTCCWLWLMDPDTQDPDRMFEYTISNKAVDVGPEAAGEHWASVTKFPFLQTDDWWLANGTMTKHNAFVNFPKALGPQAGTLITNETYADVSLDPIDLQNFWTPDAKPTFGKCKQYGHDPQCPNNSPGKAALLASAPRW